MLTEQQLTDLETAFEAAFNGATSTPCNNCDIVDQYKMWELFLPSLKATALPTLHPTGDLYEKVPVCKENLPTGDVLCFGDYNSQLYGKIEMHGNIPFCCKKGFPEAIEVTHYLRPVKLPQ